MEEEKPQVAPAERSDGGDQAEIRGEPVEIHPPHQAARSVREFLIQLGTITAGVLIALSLEGLVEWNHYRGLVTEAKATIAREIADNKKEIDSVLAEQGDRREKLETALRFANEMLTAKRSDIRELKIGVSLADLSSASWQSAASTGALAHMEYGDVQEYSKLYALQDLFAAQQRRTMEDLSAAITMFGGGSDPHAAAAKDLEAFRERVMALRARLEVEMQFGRRLSEAYQRMLAKN